MLQSVTKLKVLAVAEILLLNSSYRNILDRFRIFYIKGLGHLCKASFVSGTRVPTQALFARKTKETDSDDGADRVTEL